jgi:hypothetical protein
VFWLVLKLKEEKQTFTKVDGGNMNFFSKIKGVILGLDRNIFTRRAHETQVGSWVRSSRRSVGPTAAITWKYLELERKLGYLLAWRTQRRSNWTDQVERKRENWFQVLIFFLEEWCWCSKIQTKVSRRHMRTYVRFWREKLALYFLVLSIFSVESCTLFP